MASEPTKLSPEGTHLNEMTANVERLRQAMVKAVADVHEAQRAVIKATARSPLDASLKELAYANMNLADCQGNETRAREALRKQEQAVDQIQRNYNKMLVENRTMTAMERA